MPYQSETYTSPIEDSIDTAAVLEDLLICSSSVTYEPMAVNLSTHAEEMADLRRRLHDHRSHLPLFQPQPWMFYLEETFWSLWYLSQTGDSH